MARAQVGFCGANYTQDFNTLAASGGVTPWSNNTTLPGWFFYDLLCINISLEGRAWVSGDLLVPSTPGVRLNGHPVYGGVLDGTGSSSPSDFQVTLSGNAGSYAVPPGTFAASGTSGFILGESGATTPAVCNLQSLALNGNVSFTGSVVAPSGAVTISGTATLTGRVTCDRLTISGDGLLQESTP